MGAAGLIEIKRRINSIESTRKITKAMALVATSKFRKVNKTMEENNYYSLVTEEILEEVVNIMPYNFESRYINKNLKGDKLYIVLTSDIGLCGGFNHNIIAFLNEYILEKNKLSKVIVVGKKGAEYLKRYGVDFEDIEGMNDLPTEKDVDRILTSFINLYKDEVISEVNIVYTEFKSRLKQEPKVDTILPIERQKDKVSNHTIEPDIKTVFDSAINIYLKSRIMKCLINSKISEETARRTAMDSATDNANQMLKELHIKFNRIRQAMITQELSEIIGGAEAQK